ncbi:MAG: hypothetical protein LBS00_06295 [Synergistaceae bacterium]|jgi:hypothetical protein|nr:hypothetical protein [Synergistaceae bacterium]
MTEYSSTIEFEIGVPVAKVTLFSTPSSMQRHFMNMSEDFFLPADWGTT